MTSYGFVATRTATGNPLSGVHVNHNQSTCIDNGFTDCTFGTLDHDAVTDASGMATVTPGTTGNHWWTARYDGAEETNNGTLVTGGYEVGFDF